MPKTKDQYELFKKDIENHSMKVLLAQTTPDGHIYRHLKCSRPDTYSYSFNVVTVPGMLAYFGDMGSFSFQRLTDMFEFFRGKEGPSIDFSYWAEKTVAIDKPDGVKEFDPDDFVKHLLGLADACVEPVSDAMKNEIMDIASSSSNEYECREKANLIQSTYGNPFDFYDMHSPCTKFTTRFTWCCYAIQWAIARYDEGVDNE